MTAMVAIGRMNESRGERRFEEPTKRRSVRQMEVVILNRRTTADTAMADAKEEEGRIRGDGVM